MLNKTFQDDVIRMSASLAYFSALSLAPLLILMLNFLSWIHSSYKKELFFQIHNLAGPDAGRVVENIAANIDHNPSARGMANIFGLITLLVSASAIFVDLRTSLDKILGGETAPDKKGSEKWFQPIVYFLKDKLFNMGLVLGFIFISIISLIVSSVLSFLANGVFSVIGELLNFIISLLVYGVLFSTIYLFLPKRKLKKRYSVISGLLSALLFSFGKTLIGIYLGQSATASLYGAAGSLIVMLLWVFYSAIIFFICAEFAHEISLQDDSFSTIA